MSQYYQIFFISTPTFVIFKSLQTPCFGSVNLVSFFLLWFSLLLLSSYLFGFILCSFSDLSSWILKSLLLLLSYDVILGSRTTTLTHSNLPLVSPHPAHPNVLVSSRIVILSCFWCGLIALFYTTGISNPVLLVRSLMSVWIMSFCRWCAFFCIFIKIFLYHWYP